MAEQHSSLARYMNEALATLQKEGRRVETGPEGRARWGIYEGRGVLIVEEREDPEREGQWTKLSYWWRVPGIVGPVVGNEALGHASSLNDLDYKPRWGEEVADLTSALRAVLQEGPDSCIIRP